MNNRANESRIKFHLDYAECSRLKAKPIMNYDSLPYNLITLQPQNLIMGVQEFSRYHRVELQT